MTLSEYLIEAVASRRTGKYHRFDGKCLEETDKLIEFLQGTHFTKGKDTNYNSYTIRELYSKYEGTDTWFTIVKDGKPSCICVVRDNKPGKILRFTISEWNPTSIIMSEIIDISMKGKTKYDESYSSGNIGDIVDMVNRFMEL